MSGEFTDTGSRRALDAVTGRATVTSRVTYLALYTSLWTPIDATTDGTISTTNEYAATGYSRVAVTWGDNSGAANPPSLNSGVMTTANVGTITFGPFTAGTSATIQYAALVSASSGAVGDMLAYWTLDSPRTPATNDSISIAAAQLKLAVD